MSTVLTTADMLQRASAMPDGPRKQMLMDQLRRVPAPKPAAAAPAVTVPADGEVLQVALTIRLKTISEANSTDWGGKIGRKKLQRSIVREKLQILGPLLPPLPSTIQLIRVGRQELDGDNLQSALKAVRDGVADVYGVDDKDKRYTWNYDQRTGKCYAVEIRISGVGFRD
jgi:hypothetical protein